MNYNLSCITNAQKQAWCQVAQALLQDEHNIMGEWYDPSKPIIPESTYQKLRAEVQISWPYTGGKLSKQEWIRYLNERFNPKSNLIGQEASKYRKLIFDAKAYSINLDDDIN